MRYYDKQFRTKNNRRNRAKIEQITPNPDVEIMTEYLIRYYYGIIIKLTSIQR